MKTIALQIIITQTHFRIETKKSFFSTTQKTGTLFFNSNIIQTKPIVGMQNNSYEQEADLMYDKTTQTIKKSNNLSQIQPKYSQCDHEEKLQKKDIEQINYLQTPVLENNTHSFVQTKSFENQLNNSKGKGAHLSKNIRSEMEPAFDSEFDTVKIHTNETAIQMNRNIGARAFTYGNDIFFNKGAYNPTSPKGKRLLAHELTHVIQQKATNVQKAMNLSATSPRIQRDLEPPGNCIQGIHDGFQSTVKAWCDHPSGRACVAGDSCHRLQQKIRRNQMCAQTRRHINNQCYDGGDLGHRIAERDARRAQGTCMALFRRRCRNQPPRVPIPVPDPIQFPQVDKDFMERMAEITGLTGTALILYLIISEGSRLFPPRNLVPIP
ncbi:eCIS core domain-containing protein [Aquimarina agarivorans]|uniref:eCIS core domain-containing protein n=1 Tax=Aquimarina agarivorans TaxID=980584 RepID=UPI000248E827|nr:DUF4157 domain-containing protein [Aquimarina agarivorans]